jgi:2-dehydro-3-deoxyphosphogluconate aldolase/(4S)-4-hydroxy-2-oxoglutarate aldolase
MKPTPLERIQTARIMPVVILNDAAHAEPLAQALLDGGLAVMEVTFRTTAAAEAIRRIAAGFPQMLLGAGTLLEPDQVRQARDAGAVFGVAPGLREKVVEAAASAGLFFAPGVMTPSDVEHGLSLGCKLQKFFPAAAAGGAAMLKALAGPYTHTGVKFLPTGGIDESTMGQYLKLPVVAAVGGSWMVDPKLIAAGEWTRITELTRHAVAAAKAV